ncbi:MAG: cysteine hydrolase [Clostridiales Family XIII bacterium]|jgi:nicotinamidase-related amidase|nr:cysteine hydrolase [Clostridiales Family XIII bacterium]
MADYLIVIDMQQDFIDGSLGTPEAVAIVPNVTAKIRTHLALGKGPVLFTYDTHQTDYLKTTEGRKLPVEHCIEGTEGWKLHPEIDALAKQRDCISFKKPTFGSKELAAYLADANDREPIETIELIGLCTDICVISNAILIKSFLPETLIRVDSTCCAGVTPESHENALSAMRMCHIDIL